MHLLPHCGVIAIRRQILLPDTCQLYGSRSVVVSVVSGLGRVLSVLGFNLAHCGLSFSTWTTPSSTPSCKAAKTTSGSACFATFQSVNVNKATSHKTEVTARMYKDKARDCQHVSKAIPRPRPDMSKDTCRLRDSWLLAHSQTTDLRRTICVDLQDMGIGLTGNDLVETTYDCVRRTSTRVKFGDPTHGSAIACWPLRGHEHGTVCQPNCGTPN